MDVREKFAEISQVELPKDAGLGAHIYIGKNGNVYKDKNAITPAADVAPVVHGEWNKINRETTGLPWEWRCNQCGCPQDYAHNFCPNCGAKMDGDKHEDQSNK